MHRRRWEFIKENTLSTKKKRKKLSFFLDIFFLFSYFLVFFCKFSLQGSASTTLLALRACHAFWRVAAAAVRNALEKCRALAKRRSKPNLYPTDIKIGNFSRSFVKTLDFLLLREKYYEFPLEDILVLCPIFRRRLKLIKMHRYFFNKHFLILFLVSVEIVKWWLCKKKYHLNV